MLTEHEIQHNKEEIIALLQSTNREGMPKLIKYLEDTDFFVAPASTKYHNCFAGGLALHSLLVYKNLLTIVKHFKLDFLPADSMIICAILHDVCKINVYKYSNYVTKNGGRWAYEDILPLGHGEKSIILLQNFIKLNVQELIVIRWHMGDSDCGGYYQKMSLDNARNTYPALTIFMCCDLISSFCQETRVEKGEPK